MMDEIPPLSSCLIVGLICMAVYSLLFWGIFAFMFADSNWILSLYHWKDITGEWAGLPEISRLIVIVVYLFGALGSFGFGAQVGGDL